LTLSLSCIRASNPQPLFESARQAFLHGDLIRSQQEAEKGYYTFARSRPEWSLKFRVLEAEALMWQGMSDQVLRVLDSTSTGLPAMMIPTLALKAVAHSHLHEFDAADHELTKAEQLCASSTDAACGDVIRGRGLLAWEHGQFVPAQRYFEQTLVFAQAHKDRFLEATALLNLGASLLYEQHFDEAITLLGAAHRLSTTLDAGSIQLNASGNLGWAYYQLGDSEKALGYLLDAEKRATQLGSVIDEVAWLTAAGYVYLDAKKFSVAEQSYLKALDLAQKINSKEDILNALMSLALVSEQSGKLAQASQYSDRAISMARLDGNRLDELYPLLVTGQLAAGLHDTTRAEKVFWEVAQDPKSDLSLRWEAQHELALLYETEKRAVRANQEYQTALSTFETARSSLRHEESELPFLTNASRMYDDYVHFLVAQGKITRALQVANYSRARTLAEGLGVLPKAGSFVPTAINAREVAARVGGPVLFYWLGDRQSYLWAVTPQRTTLFQLPPASEITAVIERYRTALVGPRDVLETSNRDGSLLYSMLVAPASDLIRRYARVVVIPDESLNNLNFETLLVPGTKPHYWIEDVTIINATSLRLLAGLHGSQKSGGKLLLIGDAVVPDPEYGELPQAAAEMANIEKYFSPSERRTYAGLGATVQAYLASNPQQFSYIHFVAHGTASRLSPLDSAIVLSKSGPEEDSFKLYAREIIHHPLNADLVTISTCYGAGARAYTGEGLVGLSWAFLRAGAHNVIGALWEVSDMSTPQLMGKLYGELRNGQRPETALRNAKLALLHSKGVFRKPFYWAPFQLYTGS
jgi:CHAT domain-containing protein